jgi:AmmeMemoRadiSam system protein B
MTSRCAAVAGTFYPDDAGVLEDTVRRMLAEAGPVTTGHPKALIAPHAGYVYSGPIAASAYRQLDSVRDRIRRVVLLGPAHRVYLQGMALPSVEVFTTPCGDVHLDMDAIERVLELPHTTVSDEAHATEHCLEVHLPFLQAVLDDFLLVPIVVGACAPEHVAAVLEALWGAEETLTVVSSDLSHYHPYADARKIDAQTSAAIVARSTQLTGEQACGAYAINGLMLAARTHDLSVSMLDVRNSGDTAGGQREVVGYGAYALRQALK